MIFPEAPLTGSSSSRCRSSGRARRIAAAAASGDLSSVADLRIAAEDEEFLSKQTRIALRHCGVIDPESLDAYRAVDGYRAIAKILGVGGGPGMTPEQVIDEINILNATKRAMAECVTGLSVRPDIVLVDAVKLALEVPTTAIIKGDALSYSIAAASILAKVYRDRLMREYDKQYPQYGFAKHKGYGTKDHIDAIRTYGPCPIHRRTFITHFTDDE